MKKLFALLLSVMLVLALTACSGNNAPDPVDNTEPAPASSSTPSAPQQEPSNNAPSNAEPVTPDTPTPDEATPEAASGEVVDFDTGISAIPAEWQKAIGTSMFGINTGAGGNYSDSYTNKFSGVSEEDYAKLIAYFDTLSYTEKLDGVYNCDWGQLQIGHNADASEMTISWYAN